MVKTMLDTVLQTINEYQMLARGERVVCAVSGGADSVAMLRALCLLRERLGIEVCAVHCNHGLRGAESDRDAAFAKALCAELGVSCYTETLTLDPHAPGLEARAREARYAFFARAAEALHAQKIATAHHANDNLETLLFHLARGSGLRGLCGIPPVRGNIIRPMLMVTKEQILAFLRREGAAWVEDATNYDEDFTRNLIRARIVPLLCEISPAAVENSARCQTTLRQDEDALCRAAEDWLAEQADETALPIAAGALPDALAARVVQLKCKKIMKKDNQVLDFAHVCAIINLMRQPETVGRVSLAQEWSACRAGDRIYFVKAAPPLAQTRLRCGESLCVSGYRITCTDGEILVRARRDGDRIRLAGRKTRLIKKIFCDAKIPRHLRDQIPVIERDGAIIAICGFGFAEGYDNGGVQIAFDS